VRTGRFVHHATAAAVMLFLLGNAMAAAALAKTPEAASNDSKAQSKTTTTAPDNSSDDDTITVELSGNYALFNKELSGLAKPQKLNVPTGHRHVWLWVPRDPGKGCYDHDRIAFPKHLESDGSKQPLAPRIVELMGPMPKASDNDTGSDVTEESDPLENDVVKKEQTAKEMETEAVEKEKAAQEVERMAGAKGHSLTDEAMVKTARLAATGARRAAAAAAAAADIAEVTKADADAKAAKRAADKSVTDAKGAAEKRVTDAREAAADRDNASKKTSEALAAARKGDIATEEQAKQDAVMATEAAENKEAKAEIGRANDQDIKYATVALPPLQFGIRYCLGFGSQYDSTPTAVTLRGVPWPLNDTTVSWWSQRYVTAAVGLGYSRGMSWGTTPGGYDATTSPFVYVGAHITPWPTDRHIPIQDRVSTSPAQHFHIIVAAAITDPWPNANTVTELGAKGLVLGAGLSGGDGVIACSVALVLGEGAYAEVDALGNIRNKKVTLVSPVLGISTQADIVGWVAKAFQK
jgi:hypothetical protein